VSDAQQDLPISFSSFVVSLASSAMLHLGETAHPETGTTTPNLPLARQTIAVLAILQEKTKGNLDEEESQLLGTLLDDLRGRHDKLAGAASGS
jgi:hypothetical protein